MNINFNETYKSLHTAELLNIVQHPNDYQSEAVLAAIALLKGRIITYADYKEAEQILADTKDHFVDETKYLNTLSTKIENLVDPIVNPYTKVNTKKWMNILIISLGIYTIWDMVELSSRWQELPKTNHIEYFRRFEIVQAIYLIITIAGLYKRKKWGWLLLMIFFVLETLAFASEFYLSLKFSFLRMHLAVDLMATLIYGGAVYLLSRHDTKIYFNINNKFIRNTVFSAIIIFLLIQVFFKYFQ